MRKSRRILLVTLLIAIFGFASWLLLSQPGEPVYQGKPLSFWCEQYQMNLWSPAEKNTQARIAIRTIGTNGIPTLLRMLKTQDSKFKVKLLQLASKQHLVDIKWTPAPIRHNQASLALVLLGPKAQSAVPELIKLLADPSVDIKDDAANALQNIDPAAANAGVK